MAEIEFKDFENPTFDDPGGHDYEYEIGDENALTTSLLKDENTSTTRRCRWNRRSLTWSLMITTMLWPNKGSPMPLGETQQNSPWIRMGDAA